MTRVQGITWYTGPPRDNSKEGTEENALRVYVCRTRDFVNFTEPKVWLSEDRDSGSEVNIIDSTIVEDNGKFYRFYIRLEYGYRRKRYPFRGSAGCKSE